MPDDVPGAIACEKERRVSDIVDVRDAARGNRVQHRLLVESASPEVLNHAFGRNGTGGHCVDAQAPARPFEGDDAGKTLERRLARAIKPEVERRPAPRD